MTRDSRFDAFDLLCNPVWVLTPNGGLRWANLAAVSLVGASSRDEMAARAISDIFLKGPSRLLFLGIETDSGHRERQRWVADTPGGPVHVDCDCSGIALEAGDTGLLVEGRIAAGDRADLVATQFALAEAKRLLASVLDNSPVGLAIVDSNYRIRFVNKSICEIFSVRADDLTGQTPVSLFASEAEWRNVAVKADCSLSLGEVFLDEVAMRRQDGRSIWCSLSARSLEATPGNGTIWGIVDVTPRIESQERLAVVHEQLASQAKELARSNAELESFAYVASHDLRQPLRQIHGYLSLIERTSAGRLDDESREFLAFARAGALRMDRLIQDLLDYGRIGRTKREPEPVDLDEAIAATLQILGEVITDCGGAVDVDMGGLKIAGYAPDMIRLFQNLIGNGLKYHAKDCKPEVRVTARKDGGGVEIAVSDNGIGIEPAQFERIFNIFQRLHSREDYEGTGIGLAICRKIVEQQHGRIWVESKPGTGSTFLVWLPAI